MKLSLEYRKEIIQKVHHEESSQPFSIEDLEIKLNKYTLVPHPDTVLLIEKAANLIRRHPEITTVADIGTGSGFIAISLARQFPDIHFIGSDSSSNALTIAQENARINNASNVDFKLNQDGVWLSELFGRKIDCIVSNPPFVGTDEYDSDTFKQLFPEVALEPVDAIKTHDKEGVEPYISMMTNAKTLNTHYFVFQCNSLHIHLLGDHAKKIFNNPIITTEKDHQGNNRYLVIENQ